MNQNDDGNDGVETILSVLQERFETMPRHGVFTWLDSDAKEVQTLTYEQLWTKTCAVADLIRQHKHISTNDRVMVCYPFGLDFLAGLLGCMRAGVIACSVYPPNPKKFQTDWPVFLRKAKDANAKYALTTAKFKRFLQARNIFRYGDDHRLTWIATDKLVASTNIQMNSTSFPQPSTKDIAFIQYSSGSTGFPKGVMVSHESALGNARQIMYSATKMTNTNDIIARQFVLVSWVPQYHDMGLLGCFMASICAASKTIVFSPLDFIHNPLMWHDSMVKYKADMTLGPNFAFGLVARRLEQRWEREGGPRRDDREAWRRLRSACVGAEPIDPNVLESMTTVLGVSTNAFVIAYGMAETGLYVAEGDGHICNGLVGCGRADGDVSTLRIVNAGQELPDGIDGDIWVQTPLIASGYWNQAELTKNTFENQLDGYDGYWLATGDMGRIINGNLYITGRKKEVIIINGRNYYAVDFERSLDHEFVELLRPGCTVAFQYTSSSVGIVAELRPTVEKNDSPSAENIQQFLSYVHGVNIDYVCILKSHSVPKTTSGKLKRLLTKQLSIQSQWKADSIVATYISGTSNSMNNAARRSLTTPTKSSYKEPTGSKASREIPILERFETFEQILCSILGSAYDANKSWEENGLTSTQHADLSGKITDSFGVAIPPTFHTEHPTPLALKAFVERETTRPFPVQLPELEKLRLAQDKGRIPTMLVGVLQAVGVLVHVALVGFSLVLAIAVHRKLQGSFSLDVKVDRHHFVWMYFPVLVPVFMLTYSFMTILLKWTVIGRYRATVVDVYSVYYLKWWFIDRAIHLWEFLVGRFVIKTMLGSLFYRLMGAHVDMTASIDAHLREFDLIKVGRGSAIKHEIRCRRFGPWGQESAPTMRFRPITIGHRTSIDGMVCPGAHVGEESIVSKFSVVPEGGQVPSNHKAFGSPATDHGVAHQIKRAPFTFCWILELGKIVWLFAESYLFFGLWFGSTILWTLALDGWTWRYTELLLWFGNFWTVSVFAILVSIYLKWLLIGHRDPGQSTTPLRRLASWICDYHFGLAIMFAYAISSYSKFWLLVLWMHGLDTDLLNTVIVDITYFPPSKLHLIRLQNAFVSSALSFKDKEGVTERIEVVESSIGYRVAVNPGIRLHRCTVRPLVHVEHDIYANERGISSSGFLSLLRESVTEIAYLVEFVVLFWSLVPMYELLEMAVIRDVRVGGMAVVVAVAIAPTVIIWTVLYRILQTIVVAEYGLTGKGTLYRTYNTFGRSVPTWCFWWLWWGTPLYKYLLCFMGTKIEGEHFLYHGGTALYDYFNLTFADKTVIDNGKAMGHYQVFQDLTLAPTRVAGVMHPGSMIIAGYELEPKQEYGPWRLVGKHRDETMTTAKGDVVA